MTVFAVSDLHLSLASPFNEADPSSTLVHKPMNVFGGHWDDYLCRLKENWLASVNSDDTVLIPGDISWAMDIKEAQYDIAYLASLPGRKIISRGNHDYWWSGIGKVRASLSENMYALQNDAIDIGEYAVCATRGWTLPSNNDFKESEDRKIYDRELLRLGFALKAADKLNKPIITMLHYPPLDISKECLDFVNLLGKHNVVYCVYGHIHGNKAATFEGNYNGIEFVNVSIDRIDFKPLMIAE